ncbi:MAG: hypothetical protein XXXJIFNMEKO3_02715 [Candidatus Erwinia impunctatus]|nr:hypothetical protein XXXJIFNMEKO_02715 [Culicoides impunctatus]
MQKARAPAPGSAIAVSARSVHLGVVSALLQGAALLITADIDRKTLTADQEEAHKRYFAGVQAFDSTVVATIETAINYYKFSTSLTSIRWLGSTIVFAGKAAGVAGGFICAAYDFRHGLDELNKGRTGLAIVYFASAGSGFALSLIAAKWLVVSGPAAIVLAIIFISATAIIMVFTPDAIQKWLRQCLWRRIPVSSGHSEIKKQQYLEIETAELPIWPTMEMEMQQLNLALGNGG